MSRNVYPVSYVNSPEQVTLKFRFQTSIGADPDLILPHKCGVVDITYTATKYTITFDEKYPVFIGGFAHVMPLAPDTATNSDYVFAISPADYSATNGTLIIYPVGVDGTTAAEQPADNDWVYCEFTFCRRSALAPSGAL